MYALDSLMNQTFRKGATKEKLKYLNSVTFIDRITSLSETLTGVASVGMLCETIVFESFTDLIAPNLLRAHQED